MHTTETDWVIKSNKHDEGAYELSNFLHIIVSDVKNAVETHPYLYYRCGISESKVWYSMRAYDAHVTKNDFCRHHWKRIAISVLYFLCSLHRKALLVHMDIKMTNILIKLSEIQFVVGDYDQTDIISDMLTCEYEDDIKWYYIAMGAELHKPLKSWRFDLVSLGYMLSALTWSADNAPCLFFPECQLRRKNQSKLVLSDDELITLRNDEMAKSHPTVLAYFEIVKELDWSAPAPPPKEFYRRLADLFIS